MYLLGSNRAIYEININIAPFDPYRHILCRYIYAEIYAIHMLNARKLCETNETV